MSSKFFEGGLSEWALLWGLLDCFNFTGFNFVYVDIYRICPGTGLKCCLMLWSTYSSLKFVAFPFHLCFFRDLLAMVQNTSCEHCLQIWCMDLLHPVICFSALIFGLVVQFITSYFYSSHTYHRVVPAFVAAVPPFPWGLCSKGDCPS